MVDSAPSDISRSTPLTVARDAVLIVRILRMPIILTLLVFLVLVIPEQTIEIYRSIVQRALFIKDSIREKIRLGLAAGGLFLMAMAIWYVAALLTEKLGHRVSHKARWALECVPRTLVLLVFLSAALGVFLARTPEPTDEVRTAAAAALQYRLRLTDQKVGTILLSDLFSYNGFLLIGAVVLAIAGAVLAICLPTFNVKGPGDSGTESGLLFKYPANRVAFCAVMIVTTAFIVSPTVLPRSVGTFPIFSAFIACLAVVLGQLSYWSDQHHVPYVLILMLVAVAFSLLDLNDNHTIYRTAPYQSELGPAFSSTASAAREFRSWWEARGSERARYLQHNRSYPIYVVAAEGGGIYAAAHTANVLSTLQHRCPAFAQHLFAISGVSGGSIGAVVFDGFLKEAELKGATDTAETTCYPTLPPYKNSIIDASDRLLNEDLLSPLVAALLFPDLIQRFLPFPIDKLDRALRFEAGFEYAMDVVKTDLKMATRSNFLASRFIDHWHPDHNTPALLLNTTEVGSGRRRVIAPFEFSGSDLLFLPITEELGSSFNIHDLPVSTAAVLSARFPWVSPAGTFYDFNRDKSGLGRPQEPLSKVRLVDGGYFENSGVATALDIIRAMEQSASDNKFADAIRIRLIVLTRGDYPTQKFFGLNEAISPVLALLSTRTSRAYITIAEAERALNGTGNEMTQPQATRLRRINLLDMAYPPPLGWQLSPITMLLIQAQNGIGAGCKPGAPVPTAKSNYFDADCEFEEMARELKME